MKTLKIVVAMLFFLCVGVRLQAQANAPQGAFPAGMFQGDFRKYVGGNPNSQVYSWEGLIGADIALYRKGKHTVYTDVYSQTIGARTLHSRINLAGTSYRFGLRYEYALNSIVHIELGAEHLSSHRAENLRIVQNRLQRPFPEVDTGDLNIIFWGADLRFDALPFEPRATVRIQPMSFSGLRFHRGLSGYDRPLYLATEVVLWKGHEKRIVIATKHEVGWHHFHDYAARLELFAKDQREGRFQLFIGGSPGEGIYVSINDGWRRDGLYTGFRIVFGGR